jgi:hypothetical protein
MGLYGMRNHILPVALSVVSRQLLQQRRSKPR